MAKEEIEMTDTQEQAKQLVEHHFSDEEKAIFLLDLWRTRNWRMIDILNTYYYVKDIKKVYLVLDTASSLGLSYMDICSLIKP